MGVGQLSIHGDEFIGAYCIVSDSVCITGSKLKKSDSELFEKVLLITPTHLSASGSDLIGLFGRANKNGILLSNSTYNSEFKNFKNHYKDITVEILESDLNAIGNNILVNDKIAIINPDYKEKDVKKIKDVFDVEVIQMEIAGYKTIGSHNILTNKGFVVNNNVSEEEFESLKSISKSISQSTANKGSLSIGISVITNSNGIIFGKNTSGFEMANIQDGLNID
ncbi:MAG: translation initiation factor IF-6 [Candidatus Micrarchaeaceae archaeon]